MWKRRILWWWRRKDEEADLQEELRAHVALEAAERAAEGLTHGDAERAANRAFGNRTRIAEETRDVWRFAWLEELWLDVRYASRNLTRSPGFAFVAILTAALGIGATTAIFSVVNALLLKPLPYKDADRLVRIIENVPAEESFRGMAMRLPAMSPEEFGWWREQVKSLSQMAVAVPEPHTLMLSDLNVRLDGTRISAAMFPMYGIAPSVGRGFTDEEERADASVVVLSSQTWRRYFGGSREVLNRSITLDNRAYTVIGVMPAEFGEGAFWLPYSVQPARAGTVTFVPVTSRLAEGVSMQAATEEINALGARLRGLETGAPRRFELARIADETVARVRPALRVLAVAAGVVLLIVCANLANLLLTRGARRVQEIATRRALGAAHGRLVRQLLTESAVLALAGGVAGVAVAYGSVTMLKALAVVELPAGFARSRIVSLLPRVSDVEIDLTVLLFAVGTSLATGLLFGLIPAIRLTSDRDAAAVRNGATQRVAGWNRGGRVLGVAQLALAMPLLVGAGLLLQSFLRLTSVDLGFNPEQVLNFDLVMPDDYLAARKLALADELDARLRRIPGVAAAGWTDGPPLSNRTARPYGAYDPPRKDPADREHFGDIEQRFVSPGYLRAIGARLIAGRWLEDRDRTTLPPAILVNERWARYYFGSTNVEGQSLNTRSGPAVIAGVVGNVRLAGLDSEFPMMGYVDAAPALRFSDRQLAAKGRTRAPEGNRLFLTGMTGALAYAVRVSGDPLTVADDVRRLIREIDPAAAIDGVMTMENLVAGTAAQPRFFAVVASAFGVIALLVATIGIYGVLSYSVAQRTREIGVRVALGAANHQVLGLVLHQGFMLTAAGIVIGLAGSAALSRYLTGMLYGLTPLDAPTFAIAAVLFLLISLVATYIPARRAAKVDPVAALRAE